MKYTTNHLTRFSIWVAGVGRAAISSCACKTRQASSVRELSRDATLHTRIAVRGPEVGSQTLNSTRLCAKAAVKSPSLCDRLWRLRQVPKYSAPTIFRCRVYRHNLHNRSHKQCAFTAAFYFLLSFFSIYLLAIVYRFFIAFQMIFNIFFLEILGHIFF